MEVVMKDSSQELPLWFQRLEVIRAELSSSLSLTDLAASCKEVVHEADLDPSLDHRIKMKMHATFSVALASPNFQLRRNLRSFLEQISPKMHKCTACRHERLVIGPLDHREVVRCGHTQMVFPLRNCSDSDDLPFEWLSGSASSHPAEVPVTSHLARRTSRELDVLAFVAEAVRLGDEPSKTRHAKDLGVRREDRVKGKRSARKRPTGLQTPVKSGTTSSNSRDAAQLLADKSNSETAMPTSPITPHNDDAMPSVQTPTPTSLASRSQSNFWRSASSGVSNLALSPLAVTSGMHSILIPGTLRAEVACAKPLPGLGLLGRAISDPEVLQRELARGIPPLDDEEPTRLATAAAVLRAGVESSSYNPGRPLSRAISDPRKLQETWQTAAEPWATTLQPNIPLRGHLVEWQAMVRFTGPMKTLDLFTLVAALPTHIASTLPEVIPLDGIRPRDAIRMDTVLDKPLVLQLGKVDEAQRHAVIQMERSKIAVFAQFPMFDFVLVPHLNSRELLHVIGLRMEKSTRPQCGLHNQCVAPLSRTVSAFPALGKDEKLYDGEATKWHLRAAKPDSKPPLDVIKE